MISKALMEMNAMRTISYSRKEEDRGEGWTI
jgi:hypothetical protein